MRISLLNLPFSKKKTKNKKTSSIGNFRDVSQFGNARRNILLFRRKRIQNPVEYQNWNFFQLLTIFAVFYNTFISNAKLKLAKFKQILSNTLRLNFCYLKIIHILHPHSRLKIMEHSEKQAKEQLRIHTINHNGNEDENEKQITQIRHKQTFSHSQNI